MENQYKEIEENISNFYSDFRIINFVKDSKNSLKGASLAKSIDIIKSKNEFNFKELIKCIDI